MRAQQAKYSRAHNTSHQPKRNPKLANTSVRRPQAHNCYIALAQLVYTNAPPRSLLVLSFKKECNPTTLFIKNKVYQISLNLHKNIIFIILNRYHYIIMIHIFIIYLFNIVNINVFIYIFGYILVTLIRTCLKLFF